MSSSRSAFAALPRLETQQFTFANGLELLVHEDHSAPVASIQAWVRTGSIHEGRFMGSGISHLLEHLLFKGTGRRSGNQIAQQIQDVGGYVNAYTSFDRTVYWVDLPAKGVPVGLDVLADAVFHSTLPEAEYAKEQEVIRREFAMGFDDPDRVLGERLFSTAYLAHPYRHPIIGHLDVFNAISRHDVLDYYRRRYAPNNVFFVVAGAVDASVVRDQLEQWVGGLPRLALEPVWIPSEPDQTTARELHAEGPTELGRMNLAWHVPHALHTDIPPLDLLASILGDGRSARLYRTLREQQGLVHSVGAWTYTPSEPGLFGFGAVLEPEKIAVVQTALLEEAGKVRDNGVTQAELDKVRRMRLSGYLGGLSTARGRASDLGDSWMLCRNPDFSRVYAQSLAALETADLQRVARGYLSPERVTVVSLRPEGSPQAAGSLATRVERGSIRRSTLKNGLRVLLCAEARLPLVTLQIAFKAGRLVETPSNNGISKLFSRVLLKGTVSRTSDQIAEELESLGGSIAADAGRAWVSVGVSVLREDLEKGLEVLADVVRNAVFPEGSVEREREVQLAGIRAEREDPFSVAGQALRGTLLAGHPDGLPPLGSAESVGALGREALVEFRDRFCVGRNGVLSIFGDIEEADALALAQRYFGDLCEGEEALREPPVPAPLGGPAQVVEVTDKQQSVLMVGFRSVDMFHPDVAALSLLDEACSDLGSRMFVRIREQLGLAYSVGSSQFNGLACGSFVFYVGTDPIKQTAVLAELRDEIRQLSESGITEAELARAKEKALGAMEIRNQSLGAFASGCTADELCGLGAEHYIVERERIRSVTAEEVRGVARRYLGDADAVTAIAGPVVPEAGLGAGATAHG
jgi:zinc protease